MTEFKNILRDIHSRLDLPQPARSRVLLEIAADLQDLEDHFLEQGLPAEEARRRAVDRCDLSEAAVSRLARVHGSPYRRLIDRLSVQSRPRWERGFLAVVLILVAAGAGPAVVSGRVFQAAGLWAWVVFGLSAAAGILGIWRLYAVFLRQAHDPRHVRNGLNAIVALGGMSLATGLLGWNVSLYQAARSAALDPDRFLPALIASARSGSALLTISFLAAILTGLLWFPLAGKIARIEEDEAALLFLDEGA